MHPILVIGFAVVMFTYITLQFLLHLTQNTREPCLLESAVPFLDSAIGIMKYRAQYLMKLRYSFLVAMA
jgi:nicotinamide riboside transporter PnuC